MFDAGAIVSSLTIDRSDFTRGLSAARSEAAKGISVPVTFDISQQSVTRAVTASRRLFAASPVAVAVNFGINQASVTKATSAARKLFAASPVTVPVTFGINQASVGRAMTSARALFGAKPLTVPVVFGVSQAGVARAMSAAKALFAAKPLVVPVSFSVTAGSVAKTVAQAKAMFAGIPLNIQVNFSMAGAAAAAAAAGKVAGATSAAAAAGRGAYGVYGLLTKQLTLFGGALDFTHVHLLTQLPVWHLLADWVIEFSAVLIPATIALGVFGVAAAGTVKMIAGQLKNASTVAKATGIALGPVTGGFQKLQAAAKPQVLQLYGDALSVMGSKSGAMASVITGTGKALDYLGARMTVAITSGNGMGGMLSKGTADMARLGAVTGNLGGALGNVLKAMPGYAEIFLNLWVAVSRGVEALTAVTIPILHAGLALHGLVVYGGLAVTAVLALRGPMTALALGAAKAVTGIISLGASMAAAAASGDIFGAAMLLVDATGGPAVWITAAVVALGALVVWLARSKTAAQQFNASMQNTITNAPTIAAGFADIGAAVVQTHAKLVSSQVALADTARTGTVYVNRYGEAVTGITPAYQHAAAAAATYKSGLEQLKGQQDQSTAQLGRLGRSFGGVTGAMALLNIAGVTQAEWMDKSANGMAIVRQMLLATETALKDTGIAGGIAGNDFDALNKQVTTTYTAIQNLNTGLDTFVGNVTKTQSTFDTYAQGLATIATAPAKAASSLASAQSSVASAQASLTALQAKGTASSSALAAAQSRLTAAQDKLGLAQNGGKASIDGLSQASLQLNANYTTSIGNIQSLLDSWRVAGIAQNLQTQGTKDAIEPMLKYAAGSQEATAQLVALAEEAGYNGPASMKALTAWLGNTHDATRRVKDITNQATIQEALLTTAMQGQGSYIANKLLGDLSDAEIKYGGVTQDVQAWGKAIATQGAQSDAAQTARTRLINDLITTGERAHDSTGQIAAMITKITGIPAKKAVQLVVQGTGSYRVVSESESLSSFKSKSAQSNPNAARGMLVTGGTPGRDSVLVNTMPGEVIVPTHMVSAGAVDHLRGAIPGFAAGGVVGSFSGAPPAAGAWAVKQYDATLTAMEKSVAGATAAAEKTAAAAASIAGATTTAIGDLPANYRAIASFLTASGYSDTGASGIAGNILQESGGSPESIGDGGGGLIGWTPLPAGYVTGNAGRDLATQLRGILAYNNANGNIRTLNAQPTAADAASYYMSVFERPAVATENAQRREAGANAVFKAMGYAGGSDGAKPGWAKVGEHGQELVHFSGGETVLPHAMTSRILSGSLPMPGYAGGAGKIRDPNPVSGFTAARRKADEAKLAGFEKQLAAMEKTAAAHVTSLRVPISKDELYLLEHPDLPKARKDVLEKQLSAREAALSKYRKTMAGDEGRLSKEIALLRKIIASEPGGAPGKLPPGIGTGTRAQELAELAKAVTALSALKKKTAAGLAKLNIPVEQDELYLLQHPDAPAGTKAAVEAALTAAKKKVAAYRKSAGAQETTLSDEITILRSLTGEPAAAKYGGAGASSSAGGTGGTAGGTATTPAGQFVGTLPAPPGEGGALPSGGGTGGLGGPGTTSGGGASSVAGTAPGGSFGLGSGVPPAAAASGWGITPVMPPPVQGGNPGPLTASGLLGPGGPAQGQNVERILSQILQATRAAPAQTGGHLAGALNGTSRIAAGAARWNARP